MRKAGIESFVHRTPFEPVELRLVDGRRFILKSKETFIIGPTSMVLLDRGRYYLINLGLVSSITRRNGKSR